MERAIITISENGRVNIPSGNVWMSGMELVELFGVVAPTLRAAIKAIYKSGTLCPVSTQRCDLATPKGWATYYNLEVVIALAFRLNTYEAIRIRQMVLVELFGVIAPTLRVAIKAIYKSGTLCPVSTQRCDLATPASWATFYNLEMVIALAFRLNTYEESRIREKVLESLCQRKENGIDFLILLGDNSYLYYN